MTARIDQLRCWLGLWTGHEVFGEGMPARAANQTLAGQLLAEWLPAVIDELEQLRSAAQPPAGLVHVLAGGPAEVQRVVDGQVETVALCGTRWVPTVADPDGPVCGVCVRALIAEVDRRGADLADASEFNRSNQARADRAERHADGLRRRTEACIAEKTEADRGRG